LTSKDNDDPLSIVGLVSTITGVKNLDFYVLGTQVPRLEPIIEGWGLTSKDNDYPLSIVELISTINGVKVKGVKSLDFYVLGTQAKLLKL
jgi:hypothetical protein